MYSLLLGCGSPTTMALLNLRPESKRAQNLLNECAMWLSWNARWRHVLMARGMSTELPQSSDVLFQNYSPLIPPFNFYALLDNTVSRLCNAILPPLGFHTLAHTERGFSIVTIQPPCHFERSEKSPMVRSNLDKIRELS